MRRCTYVIFKIAKARGQQLDRKVDQVESKAGKNKHWFVGDISSPVAALAAATTT